MNVKRGDLAILINSTQKKNIGSICEVLEYVGSVEFPDMILHDLWRVEFSNPIPVEMLGSDGKMYIHRNKKALCCDTWLKPISGLEDEDETIKEKDLEDVT